MYTSNMCKTELLEIYELDLYMIMICIIVTGDRKKKFIFSLKIVFVTVILTIINSCQKQ